jgi:hypothetical protein
VSPPIGESSTPEPQLCHAVWHYIRPINILAHEREQSIAITSVIGRVSRQQQFSVRQCASVEDAGFHGCGHTQPRTVFFRKKAPQSEVVKLHSQRTNLLFYLWIDRVFLLGEFGKAKPIASPISATAKRIFIVSSRLSQMVCR